MIFYSKTRYVVTLWGSAERIKNEIKLPSGAIIKLRPTRESIFTKLLATSFYLLLSVLALFYFAVTLSEVYYFIGFIPSVVAGFCFYLSFFSQKRYLFPVSYCGLFLLLLLAFILSIPAVTILCGFWEGLAFGGLYIWADAKVTKDGVVFIEL